MMKIALTTDDGEHHVWAMLDDGDHNQWPANRTESFVIGSGRTIAEALTAAKADIEKALGDVEVMLHDASAAPNPSIESLVR